MKKGLVFIALLLACSRLFAADYYWVGGNGSWSDFQHHWALTSGGSVFHPQVPSPTDNVFFDAQSFPGATGTLTIDLASSSCRDLIWSTGTKVISIQSITPSVSINVYGGLQLAPGIMFIGDNYVTLRASSGIKNYSNNGYRSHVEGNLYLGFNGTGGQWQVTDSLIADVVGIANGQLNVSNKVVRAMRISSSAGATLKWTNSVVYARYCNLSGGSQYDLTATVFRVSEDFYSYALVDTVYLSGPNKVRIGGMAYKAVVTGRTIEVRGGTFQNLYCNAEGLTVIDDYWTDLHVTNFYADRIRYIDAGTSISVLFFPVNIFLTGNDCGHYTTIKGNWVKTSGSLTFDRVQFKDAHFSGGATITATNSVDLQGNSGVSILSSPAPITLYWVGGSGSWYDGDHWSLTSGGSPSGCVPTGLDNVVLDGSSFTGVAPYTINCTSLQYTMADIYCNNFDASQVTVPYNLSYGNMYLYGSIRYNQMAADNNNYRSFINVNFVAPSGTHIIDGDGVYMISAATIQSDATYVLQDSVVFGTLTFKKGTFNSNNYKVHVGTVTNLVEGSDVANLYMGSSKWYVSNDFSVYSGYGTILNTYPGTSHIYFSGTNIGTEAYQNLYNVTLSGDQNIVAIFLSTINKITVKTPCALGGSFQADSLLFVSGNFITISGTSVFTIIKNLAIIPGDNGCSKFTTIQTEIETQTASFVSASAVVDLDDVSIKDIVASGGADFHADNAMITGSSSGWTYTAYSPKNLYWVGGSGDWENAMHWAKTSGGLPDGCDIPTEFDNVHFDQYSSPDVTHVDFGTTEKNVRSLYMTSLTDSIYFSGAKLYVYGDLQLHRKASLSDFWVMIKGDQVSNVTTDNALLGALEVYNRGLTVFNDNLQVSYMEIGSGKTDFTDRVINTNELRIGHHDSITVDLTRAVINTHNFRTVSDSLNIITTNTKVNITVGYGEALSLGYNNGRHDRLHFDSIEVFNMGSFSNIFRWYVFLENIDIDVFLIHHIGAASISLAGTTSIDQLIGPVDDVAIGSLNNNKIDYLQLDSYKAELTELKVGYLKLKPGLDLTISSQAGRGLTVTEYLDAVGTSSLPITIKSSNSGSQATISKASGTVCAAYLYLSDINATGGATFIAGPSSSNITNNTGWNFSTACTPVTADYVTPFCSETDLQLLATVPSNVTGFLWTGPNTFISNTQNPLITNHTISVDGLYTLDAGGEIRKVYVLRNPAIDPDLVVMPGLVKHSQFPDQSGTYLFDWYLNGSLYLDDYYGQIDNPTSGDYYAVVTTPEGCSITTNTVTYDDGSLLHPPVLLSVVFDGNNQAISLTWTDPNSTEAQYSIERSEGDQNSFIEIGAVFSDGTTYLDYNFNYDVQYYYRIKATNIPYESSYSNVMDIIVSGTTPVINTTSQDLEVYPNPASQQVTVETKQPMTTISIYNVLGGLVYSEKVSGTSILLNISSLKEGIYVLEVEGEGYISRKRIQKSGK